MGVHGSITYIGVVRIGVSYELLPCLHVTRLCDQSVQHAELRDGQRERIVPPGCRESKTVDTQLSTREGILLLWELLPAVEGHPPEEDLDAGYKLSRREGFAEIVVGAQLQAQDPIELFIT